MLVYRRIENSSANGPGNRAVIWTQGCTLKCPGCWNPETHEFKGKNFEVYELVDWVLGIEGIEGVTFSGGEPFQQASELAMFCLKVKARRPDFSIGAYTGYTLEELRANRYAWFKPWAGEWRPSIRGMADGILEMMDFVVAGRYNPKLACSDKPLCGSSNQQVHFLTDRYSEADLQQNVIEIIVDPEAEQLQMTGFPSDADKLTER